MTNYSNCINCGNSYKVDNSKIDGLCDYCIEVCKLCTEQTPINQYSKNNGICDKCKAEIESLSQEDIRIIEDITFGTTIYQIARRIRKSGNDNKEARKIYNMNDIDIKTLRATANNIGKYIKKIYNTARTNNAIVDEAIILCYEMARTNINKEIEGRRSIGNLTDPNIELS